MKNYKKKAMTISVTEEVYEILKCSSNNMSSFICDLVKEHHYKHGAESTRSSTVQEQEVMKPEMQPISTADLIRKLRERQD